MPNITTNHAIAYTNSELGVPPHLDAHINFIWYGKNILHHIIQITITLKQSAFLIFRLINSRFALVLDLADAHWH